MLIPFQQVKEYLDKCQIPIKGVLHIGAHLCEELTDYQAQGLTANDIDWVEANPELVSTMKQRGTHVHQAAVSDVEAVLDFHITNNGQSSSLLAFGTHATSYPGIHVVKTIRVQTQTLKSLIKSQNIPMERRNFWNLDIQGSELCALKSAEEFIQYADAIYLEVNTQEVYKECATLPELDAFLTSKGFVQVQIAMTGYGWGDALYVRK